MPLYTKAYSDKNPNNSIRKNIIFLIIIFTATLLFAVGILIMDNKINPSPINRRSEATPTPQKESNIKPSLENQKITTTPKPTKKVNTNTCPPAVDDIDNNSYKTIQIGTQCWMKESLKVTKNASGAAINRYCYDNNISICNTDGGLYDWNTTMNGSTQEGARGICPDGWHVPKDSEWFVLENYLKDASQSCDAARDLVRDCDSAGKKLMQEGSSGFEVVIAGARDAGGSFILKGLFASFWSSTAENDTNAWYRDLNSSSTKVGRGNVAKAISSSVRCLKD